MAVSISTAQATLSMLIGDIERTGEEVVIHRNGLPVAKLVPVDTVAAPRKLGGWGPVTIPDDFDELPDDLAAAWYQP